MNFTEFRDRFEKYWSDLDRDAAARKDSHSAVFELFDFYTKLDKDERAMADRVIAEWVGSPDPRRRFDALALADQFRIAATVPNLQALEAELQERTDPEAPYELAKVRRILSRIRGVE